MVGKQSDANYIITTSDILEKKYEFKNIEGVGLYRYDSKQGIWLKDGKGIIIDHLAKMKQTKTNLINEIINYIERRNRIVAKEVKTEKNKICVKNGVFDLKKFRLEGFDSRHNLFNSIPVDYIEGEDCPKFKEFLKRACIDKKGEYSQEKYDVIQEFMGYCLDSGYKIHKFLLVYGPSDTSKTQFMTVLYNMLGEDNYESIYPQQIYKDDYVICLFGKLANIADEIPGSKILSTARLKAITGDSVITGRALYREPFKFRNRAKAIFAGNKLPGLSEDDIDDDAIYNRPLFINFENIIHNDKQVSEYGMKLFKEESSGIFNFMIEGLQKLRKNEKFSYNKTKEENKEFWLGETEHIYKFFKDCSKVNIKIGCVCAKEDLYNIYCKWCEDNDIQWLENNAFGRKIKSLYKNRVINFQPKEGDRQINSWAGVETNDL